MKRKNATRTTAALATIALMLAVGVLAPAGHALAFGPTNPSPPSITKVIEIGNGTDPYFDKWIQAGDFYAVSLFGANKVALIGAVNGTLWKNITVGTGPTGISQVGGNLWVSDKTGGNITVISLATLATIHSVKVGTSPMGIAYDAKNSTVWIANNGGTNMTVDNATTYAAIKSVTTGTAPLYPVIDTATNEIVVSAYTSNEVQFFGASNYTEFATAPGLNHAAGVTLDTVSDTFYVSDYGAARISVIPDLGPYKSNKNITVGTDPYTSSFDNQLQQIFEANSGSGNISVIADATNAVSSTIKETATPYLARGYDPVDGLMLGANYASGNVSIISDGTGGCVQEQGTYNGTTGICTSLNYGPFGPGSFAANEVLGFLVGFAILGGFALVVFGMLRQTRARKK
jgi:YVTN family beta-propeller protein